MISSTFRRKGGQLFFVLLLSTVPYAQTGSPAGSPSSRLRMPPSRSLTQATTETSAVPIATKSDVDPRSCPAPHDPPAAVPRLTEVVISSGDLLEVSVYGAADYIKEAKVLATGDITLPMAGALKVAGLTTARAEEAIARRLKEGNYFTDPRISVIDKEPTSQGISVLGEVQKPGIYNLLGQQRLFDALSAAGGITPRAGNNVTIIHRASPQDEETVALSCGNTAATTNTYIYAGDTIVVSKAGVVYVVGDVRLPGGFVMENSHMTLLQAYAMAQGANSTAALDKAELIQKSETNAQHIPLKKILAAKAPDFDLHPDDILFIPASTAKVAGRRTLEAIVQTASGMAIYSGRP